MNYTLEKTLSDWGKQQQQLPNNYQTLKNAALSELNPAVVNADNFKSPVPWLSLALSGMAFVSLLFITVANHKTNTQLLMGQNKETTVAQSPAVPLNNQEIDSSARGLRTDSLSAPMNNSSAKTFAPDYYYTQPYNQAAEIPSTDNREFIKTGYGAVLKSRDIQPLEQRVETTVRGFGGRVDSASASEQSGHISFVIPSGKLESFKTEIKNLTGARFYSESLSSQNMLPEKVSLEQQTNEQNKSLAQLNLDLTKLNEAHTQTTGKLNGQISSANKQLADLEKETTFDPSRAAQIEQEKQTLKNRVANLRSQLANENYNYNSQSGYLTSQITSIKNTLESLNTQTDQLLDNVATVRGNISFQKIGFWEFSTAYVPGYWIPIALLAAAIIVYFWQRKQNRFEIV